MNFVKDRQTTARIFFVRCSMFKCVISGWELNILESVVVTLAIGLSVDFTLHYGIMYTLAADTDRYDHWEIEQKGMHFDHDFGYSSSLRGMNSINCDQKSCLSARSHQLFLF